MAGAPEMPKTGNSVLRSRTRSGWLNATVLGIGLASFFSDLSHEAVTVLLPGLVASLGAAATALGTIEGLADGLSTVAKLYGGWLADRLRRRKALCAGGYAFMAVSPIVIAAATSWPVVLAGRALAWASRGIRSPARKSLLADAVSPENYGRAFGFERAMDTSGAVVAPLAVSALIGLGLSDRVVVLWSAVPALLAAVAVASFVRERRDRRPISIPLIRSFGGFGPPFLEFLSAAGLFGLGDFADTFFILYAVSVLGADVGPVRAAAISAMLYALHNLCYAAWSYLGGSLADRGNRFFLLAAGYACAALAAGCMVIGVRDPSGLAVMFALGGTGVGIYEAVEDAIAASLLPSRVRGSGFGLLAVVTGAGDLVSSVAFGLLWGWRGAPVASLLAMVPMAAGTLLALRLGTKLGRQLRAGE